MSTFVTVSVDREFRNQVIFLDLISRKKKNNVLKLGPGSGHRDVQKIHSPVKGERLSCRGWLIYPPTRPTYRTKAGI